MSAPVSPAPIDPGAAIESGVPIDPGAARIDASAIARPPAIALLGTSADPPTHGHRALLEGLLGHYPAVATWASDNPLKRHAAPLALRSALLGALVAAIGDPRLSLEPGLSSPWAMETLERARRRWPDSEPVFVVGSDLADQITGWRQAERWLPGCRLAIVPRCGWPLPPGALERLEALGARPELLELPVPATASSRIRARPDAAAVPPELWPLLLPDNPYGLTPP